MIEIYVSAECDEDMYARVRVITMYKIMYFYEAVCVYARYDQFSRIYYWTTETGFSDLVSRDLSVLLLWMFISISTSQLLVIEPSF